MARQRDVAARLAAYSIEDAQRPFTVAYEHLPQSGVVADVVGILHAVDARLHCKRCGGDDVDPIRTAVRDDEPVRSGYVKHALRCAEASNRIASRPLGIQHLDGVVAERRDEQAMVPRIRRKMIDAAGNARHRNDGQEFQRRGRDG